jgi:hypothetical protein
MAFICDLSFGRRDYNDGAGNVAIYFHGGAFLGTISFCRRVLFRLYALCDFCVGRFLIHAKGVEAAEEQNELSRRVSEIPCAKTCL